MSAVTGRFRSLILSILLAGRSAGYLDTLTTMVCSRRDDARAVGQASAGKLFTETGRLYISRLRPFGDGVRRFRMTMKAMRTLKMIESDESDEGDVFDIL